MEGQFGKSGRRGKMGAIPEGISFFFSFVSSSLELFYVMIK